MSKRAYIAFLFIAVFVGAISWYVVSPRLTLKGMSNALKHRNAEEFTRYINFPALQNDMKQEIRAGMAAGNNKDELGDERFAFLGAVAGSSLIEEWVEATFSPAAIRLAIQEQGARVDRFSPVSDDAEVMRDGLSQFRVAGIYGSYLVFSRQGVSWKLSGIDFAHRNGSNYLDIDAAAGEQKAKTVLSLPSSPSDPMTEDELIGGWVEEGSPCASGESLIFSAKGQFSTGETEGTWRINQERLSIELNENEPLHGTVLSRGADEIVVSWHDGQKSIYRRCPSDYSYEPWDAYEEELREPG